MILSYGETAQKNWLAELNGNLKTPTGYYLIMVFPVFTFFLRKPQFVRVLAVTPNSFEMTVFFNAVLVHF